MTSDFPNRQEQLLAELRRLRSMELDVVPVENKRALVPFKHRHTLPECKISDFIQSGRATGLGLRLDGITVIDIDCPDPSWITKCEERFGETDVRVRTPSGGIHLYYAGQLDDPPNLKGEGWPVDVKFGPNQYVVCAASWRTDGGSYCVEGQAIARDALPRIQDISNSTQLLHDPMTETESTEHQRDGVVSVGQRHDHLRACGQRLARDAVSEEDLLDALRRVFEEECDESVPLEEQELEGIARWCWDLQKKGKNYLPGESVVALPRWVVEKLRGHSRAHHLALVIYQLHRSVPGKQFCLDHKGMRDAGWTDLGRDAFRSALRALLDAGVICVAEEYKRQVKKRRYKLAPHTHHL